MRLGQKNVPDMCEGIQVGRSFTSCHEESLEARAVAAQREVRQEEVGKGQTTWGW